MLLLVNWTVIGGFQQATHTFTPAIIAFCGGATCFSDLQRHLDYILTLYWQLFCSGSTDLLVDCFLISWVQWTLVAIQFFHGTIVVARQVWEHLLLAKVALETPWSIDRTQEDCNRTHIQSQPFGAFGAASHQDRGRRISGPKSGQTRWHRLGSWLLLAVGLMTEHIRATSSGGEGYGLFPWEPMGATGSDDTLAALFAKQHGYTPLETHSQGRIPINSQKCNAVQKRSFRRAANRARRHGMVWYKGHLIPGVGHPH